MFLNIQIYFIILKTYDQQFTLTTKKSLCIIFKEASYDSWESITVVSQWPVTDSTIGKLGFDLFRQMWCALNRFHNKSTEMELGNSDKFRCGTVQTMPHNVNECPNTDTEPRQLECVSN